MIAGTAEREPPPRRLGLALLALTILALLVRVALARRGGLWRDEAIFLFAAQLPSWGDVLAVLRHEESHPPLFYALMRAWLGAVGRGDGAAHTLPVLLSAALVPAVYLAGRALFSWRAGLVAAALVALSPALAEYGVLVRPYSLLPLLALLPTVALVRGVTRGGRRWWFGYAASMLAMLYIHNWAWLVLGGQWVAFAALLARGTGRRRVEVLREWLTAQAGIALGFLPWLSTFVYQAGHAGHNPREYRIHGAGDLARAALDVVRIGLDATVLPTEGAVGRKLALAAVLVGIGAAVAAAVGRGRSGRLDRGDQARRAALVVLLVVPVAAVAAAAARSGKSDLLLNRCIAMVAPLLLLAIAHGLDLLRASGRRTLSAAACVALLATYAAALPAVARSVRSNAREVAAAVAARTAPSDLVVVTPGWLAASFNRYYAPRVEQIDFPHMVRVDVPPFTDARARTADPAAFARAERRLAEARAAGRRVWLVVEAAYGGVESDRAADSLVQHSPGFHGVGAARSHQLRRRLESLYGAPDSTLAWRAPARYETLSAYLFAPGAPAGSR